MTLTRIATYCILRCLTGLKTHAHKEHAHERGTSAQNSIYKRKSMLTRKNFAAMNLWQEQVQESLKPFGTAPLFAE